MSSLVEGVNNIIEDFDVTDKDFDVTDKELIKNIKSISKKLPFEDLFLLKMSDIGNTRKLIKTDEIVYMGKRLPDDKIQDIEKTLQDSKAVRNLIIRDKKEYAKKLDKFFGKQTSSNASRKNSRPNSKPKSTKTPPLTRKTLSEIMQKGGTFGQYRLDFDDPAMTIANEAVREFVRNYSYTDLLLTNNLLISDINLASYMLYGNITRQGSQHTTRAELAELHNRASRIVFLFRASLAVRIAFVNILVVGFLYLIYRNRGNTHPMELLESVNSLIFNGLIFDPRTPPVEPRSGLGIVFTTIYRVINSIIPVKVVVWSVVGLFVIFGDTIRTALQPDEAAQNGIPVAQPVPNSILVSFIINGARSGVIVRRAIISSPRALVELFTLVTRRSRSASERPYSAPQMDFTPSRLIRTSTGNPYDHRPLTSARQTTSDLDALRAIGVSARPYSAPQSHRFETARRREAEDSERRSESLRRGIAYREGTGTPEDQLAQFYANSPPWWERQRGDLRQSGFIGQKGLNSSSSRFKRNAHKRRRGGTKKRR